MTLEENLIVLQKATEVNESVAKSLFEIYNNNKTIYKTFEEYYDGQQDVDANYINLDNRSNFIKKKNFFKKFVDEEVTYCLSNGINISAKEDKNSDIAKVIQGDFGEWFHDLNTDLLKEGLKYGISYEILYKLEDRRFYSMCANPMKAYAFQSGIMKETKLGIYVHQDYMLPVPVENKETTYIRVSEMEIYDKEYIYRYSLKDKEFKFIERVKHYFEKTPMLVYMPTGENRSLLTPDLKSLNDSYNVTISNQHNEYSDIRASFLMINGLDISTLSDKQGSREEMLKRGQERLKAFLRQGVGAFSGEKVDAKYILRQLDPTALEMIKETKADIYDVVSHIDMGNIKGSISEESLNNRLSILYTKLQGYMQKLYKIIKKRIEFFLNMKDGKSMKLKVEKGDITSDDFEIAGRINIPYNIEKLANASEKLKDVLPPKQIISLFPWIDDIEKVYKEMEDYKKSEMDLINFGDSDEII